MMLRKAKPEDAEAIGLVRVSAWRAAYRQFMPQAFLDALNPDANIEELKERLANQSEEFTVFVAERERSVVAFAIVGEPRYRAPARTLELWAVNVLPECWRMGIGSALVERVLQYSAGAGVERLELWCLKGNRPALEAYRKLGFVESGQERSTSQLTGHVLHELHYVKMI
ncbi:GNAT family N-acetyltransferase [Marinimicrobium locisalis]|uniref:GNAT family N-acetyltransferase n=1 Tax=Marinimicrobium locisalis TaxID=546022 RepID=UPI003221E1AD